MSHSHSHNHGSRCGEDPWNVKSKGSQAPEKGLLIKSKHVLKLNKYKNSPANSPNVYASVGVEGPIQSSSSMTWTANKPYPVQAPAVFMPVPVPAGGIVNQPGVVPTSVPSAPSKISIHDAIGSRSAAEIEDILTRDPSLVNERGFNQLLPIHKAAMRGDPQIIRLLLKFKADPNSVNDFNETPLHFACKRGILPAIQVLIECGANVRAEDKAGKRALHHAVQAGSVLVSHYLLEVHQISSHSRDKNLSSPLHIICAHGHMDAFDYFCKNDRSDVFSVDGQGNTALHVAAVNGNTVMCWRLLEQGGYRLLSQLNSEHCSALQLAQRGAQPRYKEVVQMLSYYTSMKRESGVIRGPVGAWYGLLVLSLVYYPVTLALSHCFTNHGPITLISVLSIIVFRAQHSHRISHWCRWPSPAHAGMFFTLLCFYLVILPNIYSTAGNVVLLSISSPILAALMFYMYVVLLTRDPGIVRHPRIKNDTYQSQYTVYDVATGHIKPYEFCGKCEMVQPELSTHCKLCDLCYHLVDHHCLYLYRCIAKDNHRLFIAFNIIVIIAMMLFEYSAYIYLENLYSVSHMSWDAAAGVFMNEPIVWSLVVLNGVSIIWLIFVLKIQFSAVINGRIHAYRNQGSRGITLRQKLMNVTHFILNKEPYIRDAAVYNT